MRLERQVAIQHAVGSSAYRRRSARITTQVVLWRAALSMILGMGLMFAVHASNEPVDPDVERARIQVRQYAFEAFPQWAIVHHEEVCPESLADLTPFHGQAIDPWDTPLEMRCGPPIRGVYVRSAGPDRRFDTGDDISSND